MPNDSSSGGYLAPSPATPPLEGQALLDFIQGTIAGITGLDGTLVRPYAQSEPPNLPSEGNAWCAFKIASRKTDTFAFVQHNADGNGSDALQRNEELTILASFYDLGSGGAADGLASLLRDGLQIPQNREALTLQSFDLVRTTDLVAVPVMVKSRWLYRVDMEVIMRRRISRLYPILNVLSVQGTIVSDDGITRTIKIP